MWVGFAGGVSGREQCFAKQDVTGFGEAAAVVAEAGWETLGTRRSRHGSRPGW